MQPVGRAVLRVVRTSVRWRQTCGGPGRPLDVAPGPGQKAERRELRREPRTRPCRTPAGDRRWEIVKGFKVRWRPQGVQWSERQMCRLSGTMTVTAVTAPGASLNPGAQSQGHNKGPASGKGRKVTGEC